MKVTGNCKTKIYVDERFAQFFFLKMPILVERAKCDGKRMKIDLTQY